MGEPSSLESAAFKNIGDVLERVPFKGPDRAWFPDQLGFSEEDPVRLLGRLTDDDVEQLWQSRQEPPKVALRAKVEETVTVALMKIGLVNCSRQSCRRS